MKPEPISSGTAAMMVAVACVIDLVQVSINTIPIIGFFLGFVTGPVISIFAYVLFWPWFMHHGVNIMKGNYLPASIVTLITELIPGLDTFLPGWTCFVIFTIAANWRS